jgi:AbiV family abortive infection protein
VRGRKLYLRLAQASFENAVEHFNDAKSLRRRGSRGHACSLAILSIEEAAKAFLYKLAGEGVYRIVAKRPNSISTYSETQLFDHKFKHAIMARLLFSGLLYSPIRRVLAKTRRTSFSRKQVELMMADLLHEQEMLNIRLHAGGQGIDRVKQVFGILERSNEAKNAGLYVGHENGRPSTPNSLPKPELDKVIGLAGAVLDGVGDLIRSRMAPEVKRQAAASLREVATARKKASRKSTSSKAATPTAGVSAGLSGKA